MLIEIRRRHLLIFSEYPLLMRRELPSPKSIERNRKCGYSVCGVGVSVCLTVVDVQNSMLLTDCVHSFVRLFINDLDYFYVK